MKTALIYSIIMVLSGVAAAQAGAWSGSGPYVHPTGHASVVFDSKLWVLGGAHRGDFAGSSVAYSSDGANWVCTTGAAPWSGRKDHAAVTFNNRLWVLGGDDSLRRNDIWSSPDGTNWTLEAANATWTARSGHSVVVFNGLLWLLGGSLGSSGPFFSDVWSSSDGVSWTQQVSTAPWKARTDLQCVVFNNKLWLFGGCDDAQPMNDVWSSSDGVNWTQETAPAWSARGQHVVVVSSGKLLMYGGVDGTGQTLNDVWESSDGSNWTQTTASANWSPRFGQSGADFNGQVWMIGGKHSGNHGSHQRDVWASSNGAVWTQTSVNSSWHPRWDHTIEAFNNRLWVVGGDILVGGAQLPGAAKDIWSSVDGGTWTQEVVTAPWGSRKAHQSAVFNNRIWVLGGVSNGVSNDVWSSADGVNWVQETASAPWSARMHFSVVVFNNRMWVLGGSRSAQLLIGDELNNEVWSTADGVNWVQETANAGWPTRYKHASAVFNGRIWVMGGVHDDTNSITLLNDVWSSPDGVNWTEETPAASWGVRSNHSVMSYGGYLWVVGGDDGLIGVPQQTRDVWASSDGVNWTQLPDAPWIERSGTAYTIFKNQLVISGGHSALGPLSDVWSFELDTPPTITSNPQPAVSVGTLYRYVVKSSGAPVPVISAGSLPSWLSLTGSTLHGTPTAADIGTTASITLTATNSFGTDSQQFQIDVIDGPVITSSPPPTAQVGSLYTYDIVSGGVPAPTFGATGLPGWLMLSGNQLSGTPGLADIGLTGTIVVTATNASGTDVQTFQIDVQGVPPQITSTPVYSVTTRSPYSYTVTVTGTPAPTLSATGMPAWLSFDTATGTFTGTPALPDTGLSGTITVTATNAWGPDAVQVFTIDVRPEVEVDNGGSTGGGCTVQEGSHNWLWLLLSLTAMAAIRRRKRA